MFAHQWKWSKQSKNFWIIDLLSSNMPGSTYTELGAGRLSEQPAYSHFYPGGLFHITHIGRRTEVKMLNHFPHPPFPPPLLRKISPPPIPARISYSFLTRAVIFFRKLFCPFPFFKLNPFPEFGFFFVCMLPVRGREGLERCVDSSS